MQFKVRIKPPIPEFMVEADSFSVTNDGSVVFYDNQGSAIFALPHGVWLAVTRTDVEFSRL